MSFKFLLAKFNIVVELCNPTRKRIRNAKDCVWCVVLEWIIFLRHIKFRQSEN